MSVELILSLVALVALVLLARKALGATIVLAAALVGLTFTGVLDVSLNGTDRIAREAKSSAGAAAGAIQREAAKTESAEQRAERAERRADAAERRAKRAERRADTAQRAR